MPDDPSVVPEKKRRTNKIPKGAKIQVIVNDGEISEKLGGESIYVEAGISGLKRFGGLISEEFLPELRGRRGARIYTEMASNDGSIGSVIRATEDLLRSISWGTEPVGLPPAALQASDFVKPGRDDMSLSWSDFDNLTSFQVVRSYTAGLS